MDTLFPWREASQNLRFSALAVLASFWSLVGCNLQSFLSRSGAMNSPKEFWLVLEVTRPRRQNGSAVSAKFSSLLLVLRQVP